MISGKSNVVEALTRVFTSVYNDSTVDFIYEIHYIIAGNEIILSNKEKIIFLKNNKPVKNQKKKFIYQEVFFCIIAEKPIDFKNLHLIAKIRSLKKL